MKTQSFPAGFRIILAGVVLFLGWLFARMIPRDYSVGNDWTFSLPVERLRKTNSLSLVDSSVESLDSESAKESTNTPESISSQTTTPKTEMETDTKSTGGTTEVKSDTDVKSPTDAKLLTDAKSAKESTAEDSPSLSTKENTKSSESNEYILIDNTKTTKDNTKKYPSTNRTEEKTTSLPSKPNLKTKDNTDPQPEKQEKIEWVSKGELAKREEEIKQIAQEAKNPPFTDPSFKEKKPLSWNDKISAIAPELDRTPAGEVAASENNISTKNDTKNITTPPITKKEAVPEKEKTNSDTTNSDKMVMLKPSSEPTKPIRPQLPKSEKKEVKTDSSKADSNKADSNKADSSKADSSKADNKADNKADTTKTKIGPTEQIPASDKKEKSNKTESVTQEQVQKPVQNNTGQNNTGQNNSSREFQVAIKAPGPEPSINELENSKIPEVPKASELPKTTEPLKVAELPKVAEPEKIPEQAAIPRNEIRASVQGIPSALAAGPNDSSKLASLPPPPSSSPSPSSVTNQQAGAVTSTEVPKVVKPPLLPLPVKAAPTTIVPEEVAATTPHGKQADISDTKPNLDELPTQGKDGSELVYLKPKTSGAPSQGTTPYQAGLNDTNVVVLRPNIPSLTNRTFNQTENSKESTTNSSTSGSTSGVTGSPTSGSADGSAGNATEKAAKENGKIDSTPVIPTDSKASSQNNVKSSDKKTLPLPSPLRSHQTKSGDTEESIGRQYQLNEDQMKQFRDLNQSKRNAQGGFSAGVTLYIPSQTL